MKRIIFLTLFLVALIGVSSCEKHKILFDSVPVDENMAEFQLFNDLAEKSNETATKCRLECVVLNDTDTIATSAYPLNTRNVIPSGSTTRFFVREPGTYTIKGWKSYKSAQQGSTPDYQGVIGLQPGKQTVHIYNWNEDPKWFDGDYPYIRSDRPNTTEFIYFNFINLLQEGTYTDDLSQMRPTTKKLQYQMRLDNINFSGLPLGKTEWQNIGNPVAFGEQTGFCPIKVPNNGRGFRGGLGLTQLGYYTATVYTRIIDAETGTEVVGEDYWSEIRLGRFLHHVAYTKNVPANGVMCFQFYAL